MRQTDDMLPPDLLRRLDLSQAVEAELSARNRLMPQRPDHLLLAKDVSQIEKWLRPRIRKGTVTQPADVVFADKGWRGTRPLNVMALEHRVLYRALVDALTPALPEHLRERPQYDDFQQAPLAVSETTHISKTDIASYYVYVDHDLLADELIAQTGDELVIDALRELLEIVMGRRVGLPQVHQSSRLLGDAYIDPVRRRLRRSGIEVFTYSDDFRIASRSLGLARSALAACEAEVRTLGLVLNEKKTYTYTRSHYQESLGAFTRAEQGLFDEGQLTPAEQFFFREDYSDDDDDNDDDEPTTPDSPLTLGATPIGGPIDDAEVTEDDAPASAPDSDDAQRAAAAQKAWRIWALEDESEEAQSGLKAAVTQSLLGQALPVLGATQSDDPLTALPALLGLEPGLAPQIAEYLVRYCAHGQKFRAAVRAAVDQILADDLINAWQGMWIAHAVGYAGRLREPGPSKHLDWLAQCVSDGPDGLAATAAATLGRLQYGDPGSIATALNRLGPEWRQLALWGLHQLSPETAQASADNELDRILLRAFG